MLRGFSISVPRYISFEIFDWLEEVVLGLQLADYDILSVESVRFMLYFRVDNWVNLTLIPTTSSKSKKNGYEDKLTGYDG